MSAEVQRLAQAIEQFESRQPRDLPPALVKMLGEFKEGLTKYSPELDSPGKRAAVQAAGGGTGEPYAKAAKGPDNPSPGQQEAAKAQKEGAPSQGPVSAEQAREIVQRVFSGSPPATTS